MCVCFRVFFSNFLNRSSGEESQDDLAINVDNLWGTIKENSNNFAIGELATT
jgi:hypothetical protein